MAYRRATDGGAISAGVVVADPNNSTGRLPRLSLGYARQACCYLLLLEATKKANQGLARGSAGTAFEAKLVPPGGFEPSTH